ncbi:hypothetical protein BIW11_00788 [Tropilaelaps mercedesae]|uniref:Uncharacterized protein n=1 Tax=Tropilaelaps mercedesae TaxID=418985 RepID=A0A1V9XPD4_9ACAR|nr:hypothetical protein BIW11_00788 [Tropilaelaps mercedesae]
MLAVALLAVAVAGAHAGGIAGYGPADHVFGDAIAAPAYGHGYDHAIAAPVVAKAIAAPVSVAHSHTYFTKHIAAPVVAKTIAAPVVAKTIAAPAVVAPPIAIGHGAAIAAPLAYGHGHGY